MKAKLFEIRDRMTCISALAVQLSESDGYLARRAGFGAPMVLLSNLQREKITWDYSDWGDRTMQTAHRYIEDNFDTLADGAVVDVEFILGETTSPKHSEAHS